MPELSDHFKRVFAHKGFTTSEEVAKLTDAELWVDTYLTLKGIAKFKAFYNLPVDGTLSLHLSRNLGLLVAEQRWLIQHAVQD